MDLTFGIIALAKRRHVPKLQKVATAHETTLVDHIL